MLKEDNLLRDLNISCEVEPVKQSTMAIEQQACEEYFLTHANQQKNERFVVRLPVRWKTVWDFLLSCTAKITCN
jgi:hypothetical protein